jgi:hypothetical protein
MQDFSHLKPGADPAFGKPPIRGDYLLPRFK